MIRKLSLFLLALVSVLSITTYYGELSSTVLQVVDPESPSPYNTGSYGTTGLMQLALLEGYQVRLGSPRDLGRVPGYVVYVVVGPDKPFAEEEVGLLRRLAGKKLVGILVADERGVANSLTRPLLGVTINGSLARSWEAIRTPWKEFVPAECNGLEVLFPRPSIIERTGGLSTLCIARGTVWLDLDGDGLRERREPVYQDADLGVYGEAAEGFRAVVLSDSSIFTNYALSSPHSGLKAGGAFFLKILDYLSENHRVIVVFDSSHYNYREEKRTFNVALLFLVPLKLVEASWSAASSNRTWFYLIVLFVSSILSISASPPIIRVRRKQPSPPEIEYFVRQALRIAKNRKDPDLRRLALQASADPTIMDKLLKRLEKTLSRGSMKPRHKKP